jgi:8-oxo-dGTP pyrophosphatase MutT (NUDIX family)
MSSEVAKPVRVATLGVFKGDQLLMGLRRDNTLWTTPGGHLNDAESPIAGALRELREETGLEATPDQMQYLGSCVTPGRSGRPVELHMFQLEIGARPTLDIRNDPDQEVHGWSFVDVSNGLPAGLRSALHTPKNQLLRALGLMSFDDDHKLAAPVALRDGEEMPPAEARRMAGLGLELAQALGRKFAPLSVKRARALVEGRGMSRDDIRDTAQYFQLYGDRVGETDSQGQPTDKHLEALMWGGPCAAKWAKALASGGSTSRLVASRLGRLVASAPSLDQLKTIIGKYLYSTNIQLREVSDGIWDVHNAKGKLDYYRVVLRGGRYRFEETGAVAALGAGSYGNPVPYRYKGQLFYIEQGNRPSTLEIYISDELIHTLTNSSLEAAKAWIRAEMDATPSRLAAREDEGWEPSDHRVEVYEWEVWEWPGDVVGTYKTEAEANAALRRIRSKPDHVTSGVRKERVGFQDRKGKVHKTLFSATEGDSTQKTGRTMKEVSSDIQQAGVDDNDQAPEEDREIPGGPRRKTDAEMKEDPAEDLAR